MSTHRARKRFGQNFLHDPGIIRRIVSAVAPKPGQRLLEIGPGQGAITASLLDSGARLDHLQLRIGAQPAPSASSGERS